MPGRRQSEKEDISDKETISMPQDILTRGTGSTSPSNKAHAGSQLQIYRRRFRRWRKSRPFWGSILMIIAGLLVLGGPASLIQLALLPESSLWSALVVGAVLTVMGLIQLLAPSYALITGAVGIILSLASLIVAAGGFGIGMLLGLIGGSLGVAWRPGRPSFRNLRSWASPQFRNPNKLSK